MASSRYPKGSETILNWLLNDSVPTGGIDFCVIGVDDTYTYDPLDVDLTDIASGSITAAEKTLQNVTTTNGWLDADDVWFDGLDESEEIHAIIVYAKWAGGSLLIAYLDETSDGSLPQPIDSTRGLISWHASGIFRL